MFDVLRRCISPSGQSTNNLRHPPVKCQCPALPRPEPPATCVPPCSVTGLKCQLKLLYQGWGHTPENISQCILEHETCALKQEAFLLHDGLVERTAVTMHSDVMPFSQTNLESYKVAAQLYAGLCDFAQVGKLSARA